MSAKSQRTKLFSRTAQAVCELMRSNGASRALVERELTKAVSQAFQPTEKPRVRETPPISTMASLNTYWHIDPKYVDKQGFPRPLSWNGSRGTLLGLAQKVNGKLKARAVIRSLIRRRLLTKTTQGKWIPRAQVLTPSGLDRPQLLRTAAMIERVLRTVAFNSKRGYRGDDLLFEVMTRVPRLPAGEIAHFKRFVRSQGMVYARAVDEWLESRNLSKGASGSKRAREAGVLVLAFEEPTGDP